jgi:hypothetical protein
MACSHRKAKSSLTPCSALTRLHVICEANRAGIRQMSVGDIFRTAKDASLISHIRVVACLDFSDLTRKKCNCL